MSPPKRAPESTQALRASLIDSARRLVTREGPSRLTMRALASEAGCATGLPYKVFVDRHELVLEIVHAELVRLQAMAGEFAGRAGSGSIGNNLAWFADVVLRSPAVALAQEVVTDHRLAKGFSERVHATGLGPSAIEHAFATYLAAEQRAGRIDDGVDTDAFAFVIAGAVHNLVVSLDVHPRPSRRQLHRRLAAIASAIGPRT